MSGKRVFCAVAAVGILVTLSLFGPCALANPVKLEMWVLADIWTKPYELFMNDFKEDMLKKHNIELTYKTIVAANLDELFITAAMSKRGYDIASDWAGATVPLHVDAGCYMIIDQYFSDTEYRDFTTWNELKIDEKTYVVPLVSFPKQAVWNKALFRKAGLDPEHFPRTWGLMEFGTGFLQVCEKLKAAGIAPLVFGNKEGYANECVIDQVMFRQPFDSVEQEFEEVIGPNGTYTHPKSVKMLHLYKELYDKGYFMEDGMSSPFEEYYVAGLVGDIAAINIYGSTLAYSGLKAERGIENAGIAAHPLWADGLLNNAVPVITHTLGVAPWTKYPNEAVTIVKELLSTEYQTRALLESETVPANPYVDFSLVEDPNMRNLLFRMQYHNTPELYMLYSHPVWQAQAKYLSLFLLGEMTAEEALSKMDEAK